MLCGLMQRVQHIFRVGIQDTDAEIIKGNKVRISTLCIRCMRHHVLERYSLRGYLAFFGKQLQVLSVPFFGCFRCHKAISSLPKTVDTCYKCEMRIPGEKDGVKNNNIYCNILDKWREFSRYLCAPCSKEEVKERKMFRRKNKL